MKPFYVIATPHKDIIEGKLTMDVFAANLWQVYNNTGSDEYRDPDIFFKKTYITKGLKNLLEVVRNRLDGIGGDSVIQIQTPFGGGKTHSLIALYHMSKRWNVKSVVIVGTELDPSEVTLWGLMEKQLSGNIELFKGLNAPGKEKLRRLLENHKPLLILIDEILEYITKAAGVKVGDSNLASQTLAFLQELTEAASEVNNVCLVITLPSSILEHYDEYAEIAFQQLQKISGRVEKIYTPVEDDEIASVVRQRLFSYIDENSVRDIVTKIVDYFKRYDILPIGVEVSEYKEKFIKSYPFLPEVIDVFYQRWGSFPTFQRTRGVLRILSLIIFSLLKQNNVYITLADFDLSNQEIRRELLKHIGNEFDGIIAADITSVTSGAKQVDTMLEATYRPLKLGTRAATTIFLYSFSGGLEKGASINEIKRSATVYDIPPSIIVEAVDKLRDKLFYVKFEAGRLLFTNQPNLNKILLSKIEGLDDSIVIEVEQKLLESIIGTGKLKVFIWPERSEDIPDDSNLKLVILRDQKLGLMKEIIENKGANPRVYRNTIFFIVPKQSGKAELMITIKRKVAFEQILSDHSLNLTDDQKREVRENIKKESDKAKIKIREAYRLLIVPTKDYFDEIDLGIPTFGEKIDIVKEAYEKLKIEGKIIENMVPLVIQEKYLRGKSFVSTKQIYEASLKTLGEPRFISKTVLEKCIKEGVSRGVFGLGELVDDKPVCRYWKEDPQVGFSDSEIIIARDVCEKSLEVKEPIESKERAVEISIFSEEIQIETPMERETEIIRSPVRNHLELEFEIPKGKVSQIMGMINYLQSKFDKVKIRIVASEGKITKEEYEDKIKEALKQLGINVDVEFQ